jgi:predicted nucleic acid-binding protein
LTFDRRASLRRIKPQRRTRSLVRRADADLPYAENQPAAGRELLLDTTVYIDVLQGRTPSAVDRLLRTRIANHSTVALAELTHLFGALDPANGGTIKVLEPLSQTIDDIPAHRLSAPSARACGEAGMLAGLVTRLADRPKTPALINDAMLYLHAVETGCDVLTGNVRDFDLFDQLLPGAGLILYRKNG